MSAALLSSLTIFFLSLLVGFEVISKVPAMLHSPLMSAANSIHGIVIVGAMLIAAEAHNPAAYVLAFVAAAFGAVGIQDWQELVRVDSAFVRPTDALEQVGDATRARTALGWSPTLGFDEIVARMVQTDLTAFDTDQPV